MVRWDLFIEASGLNCHCRALSGLLHSWVTYSKRQSLKFRRSPVDTTRYRLFRAPSTKLVLDLLQLQDELGIIEDITRNQIDVIGKVEQYVKRLLQNGQTGLGNTSPNDNSPSSLSDPDGLLGRLQGELQDLIELRTNTNELVTRTIQLVNIRLEDHGQAILVFTIVTVIFLPLSFLSSFFGMNVSDIRTLESSQWIFWACAASLTTVVLGASMLLAFYGGRLNEMFIVWKDSLNANYGGRMWDLLRRRKTSAQTLPTNGRAEGFTVLDASHTDAGRSWDLHFAAS